LAPNAIRLYAAFLLAATSSLSQDAGALRGLVTVEPGGSPVEHATVLIVQLRRSAVTNAEGRYEFTDLPPGTYDVLAHLHPLTDERRQVVIQAGQAAALDIHLGLAPVHEHITITASGREESTLETFQTVTAVESLDLKEKSAASLGAVLENEPGVAKRSSGPGTSRPVVRGFDGDRVLILQDGIPTGTLSYQSGDHGEPIDVTQLERVEVVRGPATLLYGSSAIGGVVNAVTSHHQVFQDPHQGGRGHITGLGGSNNGLGGGSAGVEYGHAGWLLWAGGGGERTGDYHTPIGEIENSATKFTNTNMGLGRYGGKAYGSVGYGLYDGEYGIPVADADGERVALKFRRHNVRFNGGLRNLQSFTERFDLSLNYSDWNHREIEAGQTGNVFDNRQLAWRGVFEQRRRGRWSGSFGGQGLRRDYKATGEEAITPPVDQNSFALFALEQFDLEKFRLQFGARVERTSYDPAALRSRSFTGFSGAAGIQVPLWAGGSFVANYTHSYRAPALEELYAFGPHVGNLTFEIGDANLRRERAEGLDLILRHHGSRVRGDVNFFQYWLGGYVFLAPTGNIEEGLVEAAYRQSDALYRGTEARLDLGIHQNLWLNLGFDAVRAELRQTDTPLPRIPPLRGRLGFDARYKGLSVRPTLILSNDQERLFPTETRTAGYGVFNLTASYVVTRQHTLHIFGVTAFNLADNLHRNHLSFIKRFAPEIGRGVRFNYTLQVF
jgi:iron complex outermembrane recepter protein